jgi:Hemin uptake protein
MSNITAPLTKHSASPSPSSGKRLISSKALLGEEGSVLIEHNGQHYQLRQTQSGKLILTK